MLRVMHLNIKFALKDWLATIIFMFGINKKVEKSNIKERESMLEGKQMPMA